VRIAQVATCSGPVREDQTGSVESLVWLLSRELTAMGHQVTVFGCAGSVPPPGVELVVTHPGHYGERGAPSDWQVCEWMSLCQAVEQSGRFDVLHSHAYLWGLPLERFSRAPMVHTMHTCPYEDEASLWDRFPGARITAVSASQWRHASKRALLAVIHHGVDPARFTFRETPDDYLCFLGRFIPGKGPLEAIRIARQLKIPIRVAGPASDYFESQVRPQVDGSLIQYIGAVDHAQRNTLLCGARALLYPLQEPEPFGLVQIEALMCGTPVVATDIGAVPEVIKDGVTGRIVPKGADLASAVSDALQLPRAPIRRSAEADFSALQMARKYALAYARITSGTP
jgi:glycosyltransferase involved in cell wall biosynthesis